VVAHEVAQIRALAAEFRSRAAQADPPIAKILTEIADDLEADAEKLESGEG
jgi:hypothetical protein